MTCSQCRFYYETLCKRYPHKIQKEPDDTCGEFKLPRKPLKQKRLEVYTPEFNQFYAAYPKKKAPDTAFKVWKSILPEHYPLIIEWARSHAQAVLGKDMTYVKHPSTWLNSGEWKEIAERQVGKKDCSQCYAPYSSGHKFVVRAGKKVYTCAKCREKGKLF